MSPRTHLAGSVHPADYDHFNLLPPSVKNFSVDAVVDSGAQVCLWSHAECKARGFSDADLIPVSVKLVAANKSPISLAGAIILRLSGKSPDGHSVSHPTMVYVSDDVEGFFLSLDAMKGLGIVPCNFPAVGGAHNRGSQPACCASIGSSDTGQCPCPRRSVPPSRPASLPFKPIPENNQAMEKWLLETFGSSVFNKCPLQPLPCVDGPPAEIHLKPDAVPKTTTTTIGLLLDDSSNTQLYIQW